MKYVCLVYLDEKQSVVLSDRECKAFGDEVRARGQLLGSEALHPTHTATVVRVRNGVAALTDGRFAETKEQLAGFHLIDAMDLNQAIRIASRIPPALNGKPAYRFTKAVSFQVLCDTQAEVDRYWAKLGEGGDPAAQQCGRLKDRFGLSWQAVPSMLPELLLKGDAERSERMMRALMPMRKLDIDALQRAWQD